MYFINLHLAIQHAIKNKYYTSVNVEVDQNASAIVMISLVLRSKKMAKTCNVLGGKKKVSPYDFIRSHCQKFLSENSDKFDTIENADVIKFLCESRKLHKYAIMCFCYNQTVQGRIESFITE